MPVPRVSVRVRKLVQPGYVETGWHVCLFVRGCKLEMISRYDLSSRRAAIRAAIALAKALRKNTPVLVLYRGSWRQVYPPI